MDTPARWVATVRLLVGHALYNRLQNLVFGLDVTVSAWTVGDFCNVAPAAAQVLLQVIQCEGAYKRV